ncbi:hypothetical protein ACRAVF_31260 [Bradyrhizobium oligotrophicum S58]
MFPVQSRDESSLPPRVTANSDDGLRRHGRDPVVLHRRHQTWSYDDTRGMIRSMQDPHYCLDNNGTYGGGAQLIIWT